MAQISSNLGRAGIEPGTLWSEGRDLTDYANHARPIIVVPISYLFISVFLFKKSFSNEIPKYFKKQVKNHSRLKLLGKLRIIRKLTSGKLV